jgi:hypothetical protein
MEWNKALTGRIFTQTKPERRNLPGECFGKEEIICPKI